MEVPSEETLGEIRRRYLALNSHAGSYVWKGLATRAATAEIPAQAAGKPHEWPRSATDLPASCCTGGSTGTR